MNLLTVEKMSKSYTDRMLFDHITFGINEGDKIGLLGINGTGKSTLLKIVAGFEEPDEGYVTKGKQVSIGYLAQNPVFLEEKTVLENVLIGKEGRTKSWNLEGEAKAMLLKLGIEDFNGKPSILSGGQRKRAALVSALLIPSDILILDEPTNHLDSEMAEWLEAYLTKRKGALLMVTHDRYFLDKVTNKILEIDKGNIFSYEANYTKFLERKAEREEIEQAGERKKKSLYKQDLMWMQRGARARSTKQKAHIERFMELKNREKPEEMKSVEMNSISKRLGSKTVEMCQIAKSYGEKQLIKNFSYIFLKGDRVGIIGPNGCGKSTLLKIIYGITLPDLGQIEIGQTVKIGYFSQENETMDETIRVIDSIRNIGEYLETEDGTITASQMLERFLFTGAMQYSPIGKLSGGEKRRLHLLHILMDSPNILMLDEPTNDLDIQTLTILEDYLDRFPGIVITVSHDRYFLDRVVSRIFAFERDGILKQYEGGYTDYYLAQENQENFCSEEKTAKENTKENYNKQKTDRLKFTYLEQKEFEKIEEVIENLEKALEDLNLEMERESSHYDKLGKIMIQKQELEQELEEKMVRWMYLNDLAEKIQLRKE